MLVAVFSGETMDSLETEINKWLVEEHVEKILHVTMTSTPGTDEDPGDYTRVMIFYE